MPKEEAQSYSVARGREEPATIETVSSSVNITYDADDLEVPAFMRKRGEG
jgi:hypothetical protein